MDIQSIWTERLWFSTVDDIRNIVKVKGLERDRLEAIINELRHLVNSVHYMDEPDKVITDIDTTTQ